MDLANSPSFDEQVALNFFRTAGANLIPAEIAARVKHHVALSVVGTERLQDSGYFRAKLLQERLVKGSPIPLTLVRATQFFEFVRAIAQTATEGNTVRLPMALIQPMAAEDVATAIAEAAVAAPTNEMAEVCGPEALPITKLVGEVLAFDKDPRKVVADPDALYFGWVKLGDRTLLPGPGAQSGATKFDWWLAHVPPPRK